MTTPKKWSDEQMDEVRYLYNDYGFTVSMLAEMFKVPAREIKKVLGIPLEDRSLTEEKVQQIITLRKKGMDLNAIGIMTDLSRQRVGDILRARWKSQ